MRANEAGDRSPSMPLPQAIAYPVRSTFALVVAPAHHDDRRMTDPRTWPTPRFSDLDPADELETARLRQELRMRWIVFITVELMVAASIAVPLMYGPSAWTALQSAWTGVFVWLVRRLFSR
jgi:hypothetical protein